MHASGVKTADAVIAANDASVSGQRDKLFGWSVKETAAAVATAVIRDSGAVTGNIVAHINLAASTSETINFVNPVLCPNGIYFDLLTGAIDAVVYHD